MTPADVLRAAAAAVRDGTTLAFAIAHPGDALERAWRECDDLNAMRLLLWQTHWRGRVAAPPESVCAAARPWVASAGDPHQPWLLPPVAHSFATCRGCLAALRTHVSTLTLAMLVGRGDATTTHAATKER